MRLEFFPFPFLIGIGIIIVFLLFRWRNMHHWQDRLCYVIFGLYLLGVINLTLFPIPIGVDWELRTPVPSILSRVNLIPFRFGDLFDLPPIYAIHELGGNVLLTLPFGFLIPLLTQINARQIPWLAPVVGLSTELAQLVMCLIVGGYYRSVDINDVILNGLGALVGYVLFRGIAWIGQKVKIFCLTWNYTNRRP